MRWGGIINVAVNWDKIGGNFWKGLGYFASGGLQGGLSTLGPVGVIAGGFLSSAANTALDGGSLGDALGNGLVGGIAGLVGGTTGRWAGKYLGNLVVNVYNIVSPVVRGIVGGTLGGAAGGYIGGFVSGLLQTGSLSQAHQVSLAGGKMGAGIGFVSGGIGAYVQAKSNGINPWNGIKEGQKPVTIGGPQSKVDSFSKDLNSETITNSNRFDTWPDNLKAYLGRDKPNPMALEFNQKWINNVMDSNSTIFDLGRKGYSPFYNGVEMNSINVRNYGNIVPVQTGSYFNNRIRISTWKN